MDCEPLCFLWPMRWKNCNQLQTAVICKPLVRQWQLIILFTSLEKHFGGDCLEKNLFVMELKRDSMIAYIWLQNHKWLSLDPPVYKCEYIFSYHLSLPWYWQRSPTSKKWTKKNSNISSGWKMARELNISQYAIRQILQNVHGLKPLKIQKVQDLTEAQK